MKKLAIGFIALSILLPARVAFADQDGGDYREGCGRDGAGCDNRRREDYNDSGCKYVCPKFDKSPVQDAFNLNFAPSICMPFANCSTPPEKKDEKKPGQQPTGLVCLIPFPYHCDPKPEYYSAGLR